MNQELTALLYSRYPRLYQRHRIGIEKSAMSWGFSCGDGWFDLIDRLSSAIEVECEALRKAGWKESDLPVATQVKEKFGILRFRISMFPPPPSIQLLIEQAMANSELLCEDCGMQTSANNEEHSRVCHSCSTSRTDSLP